MIECWTCDGFGYLDDQNNGTPDDDAWPCPECHGAGEVEADAEVPQADGNVGSSVGKVGIPQKS